MSDAAQITALRLKSEESVRAFAYNDATGTRITCEPDGNLSIGIGINLDAGLDAEEIDWLLMHRLTKAETALLSHAWYQIDAPRQSVLLDIAYNGGVHCLLGYIHLLAAILNKDWIEAGRQCTSSNPKLKARYEALSRILVTGDP